MPQRLMGQGRLLWIAAVLMTAVAVGCSSLPGSGTPAGSGTQPAAQASSTLYYDFPDVPIPTELTLVRDDSQVFQGGNFKSGVLAFKGRVDQNSLIAFFQASMAKENWKQLGSILHRRSAIVFQKPDRLCLISIFEKIYYTHVEVHMVPTTSAN